MDSNSALTEAINLTYSDTETTLAGLGTAMSTAGEGSTALPSGNYLYTETASGKSAYINYDGGTTAIEIALELVGCATNTSLDISNSLNETVCRDGSGGSTRHIVSGATSWSISVDGLFGPSGADADAYDIIDLANNKSYVVCKFVTNVTDASETVYIGQALVESASISGGVDDIATYNVALSGQGELVKKFNFVS